MIDAQRCPKCGGKGQVNAVDFNFDEILVACTCTVCGCEYDDVYDYMESNPVDE